MAIKQRAGRPLVGVLGGSKSDFPILEKAVSMLNALGIANELLVVSAHRTPDRLFAYAEQAPQRGIQVIIAGAGGAAHLPGMLAAMTLVNYTFLPVPEPLLPEKFIRSTSTSNFLYGRVLLSLVF